MKIFALFALAALAPLSAGAARKTPENYDSWPLLQSEFPSTGGGGIIIKGYDGLVIANGKCVTDFSAHTPDGKAYYNVVEFEIVDVAGGKLCTNGKWRAKDGSRERHHAVPRLHQGWRPPRLALSAAPIAVFGFSPERCSDLITMGARPDFSAISRSCSAMIARAGSSPSMPPSASAGTLRFDRCEPSS